MDRASRSAGRALVLVENMSVPEDRRVWPECRSLRAAGWDVTVVCPQGTVRDRDRRQSCEGVDIHRFPATPSAGGVRGYAREYALALWHIGRIVRRLSRERRFDVVHACNPPDLLLLTALPLRRRGARMVFDQHDLVPELYATRFGGGPALRSALALERTAYGLADVVLAANESFRRIAITRGRKSPEDVFVVRNGPDLAQFRPRPPDASLKRGRAHLLAYVGWMAPQDGVDQAVRALEILRRRRDDWHALFVGDGVSLPGITSLAAELGLADRIEFTGYVADKDEVARILASADVCLSPEPKNVLNDSSTLIKVAEYMAMSRPVVAYDLVESRATAGDAAIYARADDVHSFAACIDALLEDGERRARMGRIGRTRVEETLAWSHSEKPLLAAYDRALALGATRPRTRRRSIARLPSRAGSEASAG